MFLAWIFAEGVHTIDFCLCRLNFVGFYVTKFDRILVELLSFQIQKSTVECRYTNSTYQSPQMYIGGALQGHFLFAENNVI